MSLLALKLMLTLSALAGPAPTGDLDPNFQVAVDANLYSAEAFRKRGFTTEAIEPAGQSPFAPPMMEVREEAFAKVEGLEAEIASFDTMDRDLLFIRARNYAPAKLRGIYPKIPASTLQQLQHVLRN